MNLGTFVGVSVTCCRCVCVVWVWRVLVGVCVWWWRRWWWCGRMTFTMRPSLVMQLIGGHCHPNNSNNEIVPPLALNSALQVGLVATTTKEKIVLSPGKRRLCRRRPGKLGAFILCPFTDKENARGFPGPEVHVSQTFRTAVASMTNERRWWSTSFLGTTRSPMSCQRASVRFKSVEFTRFHSVEFTRMHQRRFSFDLRSHQTFFFYFPIRRRLTC